MKRALVPGTKVFLKTGFLGVVKEYPIARPIPSRSWESYYTQDNPNYVWVYFREGQEYWYHTSELFPV